MGHVGGLSHFLLVLLVFAVCTLIIAGPLDQSRSVLPTLIVKRYTNTTEAFPTASSGPSSTATLSSVELSNPTTLLSSTESSIMAIDLQPTSTLTWMEVSSVTTQWPLADSKVQNQTSSAPTIDPGAPNCWPSGVAKSFGSSPITRVPNPIRYADGQPVFGANVTLLPDYACGVLSLSHLGLNCSMSLGPEGNNAKSCSCSNEAASWWHEHSIYANITPMCQTTIGTKYDPKATMGFENTYSVSCFENEFTSLATQYHARSQCCNKCHIQAQAVQLIYWPPEGLNSSSAAINDKHALNVTSDPALVDKPHGVVHDGFTYTSPSAYLVYRGISALASCVELPHVASSMIVGKTYHKVTRAYAPEAIHTAICFSPDDGGSGFALNFWNKTSGKSGFYGGIFNGWRTIDYAELHNPPPDSQLLTRFQSCFPARSIGPDVARNQFVSPYLSFPSDVTDIDPAWKAWGDHTCSPSLIGVVDPPTVLGRATALTTTTMMTIAKTETQSSQAIPAATASAPYSATAATTSQSNRDSSLSESDLRTGGSSRQSQSDSADPASGSLSSTVQHAVKSIAKDPGESTTVVQNLGSHAAGVVLHAPSSHSGSRPGTKSSDWEEKHDSVNIAVTLMPETVKPSTTSLKSKAKPATDTRPEASDPPIVSNSNSSPHSTGLTTPKPIQSTVASLMVSNNVESVAVDSSTFDVKPTSATAPLLTQNQVLQLSSGKFEIAGQTITPGSEVKISDQQLNTPGTGGRTKKLSKLAIFFAAGSVVVDFLI